MSLIVRTAHPRGDDAFRRVIDSAFAREERESRLARELSRVHGFDEDLALLAELDGEPVGAALFSPRRLRILGTAVRGAACAPIGVLPGARGTGVGRALLDEGLARLRARGVRCVVALGAPSFYARAGFGPAFDLYTCHVPLELLAGADPDAPGWRGLRGDDLPRLVELAENSWREVDGSEVRDASASDWEAAAPDSYALCHDGGDGPDAYVRFRVRETIEVTDCCVADARGIPFVFALLRRLGREHGRDRCELHAPPSHPVTRALFHLGCSVEAGDFGGACVLSVLDWPGLAEDLGHHFRPRLLRSPYPALSIGHGSEVLRLGFRGGELRAENACDLRRHLEVPAGWTQGLLTGHRSGAELAFRLGLEDPETRALLEDLFPRRSPAWAYGPLFELADE